MEREPDMAVTGNTVEQAKHAIANVAEQATARAESGLTRAKDRTAGTLDAVAQSLRSVGNDLRGRNEETIGRFVDRAADRADQIANRLNNADPAAWIDDIEKFARREPALFIGGTEDPIFPPGHAEAAARAVPGGKALMVDGMGHALNPAFFDVLTAAIVAHTRGR